MQEVAIPQILSMHVCGEHVVVAVARVKVCN